MFVRTGLFLQLKNVTIIQGDLFVAIFFTLIDAFKVVLVPAASPINKFLTLLVGAVVIEARKVRHTNSGFSWQPAEVIEWICRT